MRDILLHSDRTGAYGDSKTPAIKGLAALDVISQMLCPLRDSLWTNFYKVRKNVVTTVHVCCRAVGIGLFDPSSTALSPLRQIWSQSPEKWGRPNSQTTSTCFRVCACGGIGFVASLSAQQKIEEEVFPLSLSIPNPIGRTIAAHPIT